MAKYDHGGGCSCGLQKVCDCGAEPDSRYVAQEGGDHYQSVYQHWDWVSDIGMGYLPGNATKYVSRWRKKNGIADLKKAMTYIDKMMAVEAHSPGYKFNREPSYKTRVCTDRFIESNGLSELEASFCAILTGPCHNRMLELARQHLEDIIRHAQTLQEAQAAPAAPTLPAAPGMPPPAAPCGAAGGTMGQAPGTSTSTEVARKPSIEHPAPFGYDGDG